MKSPCICILLCAAGAVLGDSYTEKFNSTLLTIPYLAYLQTKSGPCVGCLIHPEWVVTAAHCSAPINIRLGVVQPSIKNKKEQSRNHSLIVTHPGFDSKYLKNDVMMIKLSKPANINTDVGTIAIALESMFYNDTCFIPTWIWNEYQNNSDADILTWINEHALPNDECLSILHEQQSEVFSNIMCMGKPISPIFKIKEVPAAPAICNGRLQGILSWTNGNIILGSEGFFTEVHPYARWIMATISKH
ncbi:probable inactive serine protease 58 [Ochotona princeps]|uniref:probable inactive serine protease 58 n=1 Tax=Ochotona princeps TaxID=9978 RepID=UPI00271537E4|nr:probable inactive serine protease 58 [Ochotona princeps]